MSDNSEYRNVNGCNGGQIKHKEPDYVIALRAQLADARKENEELKTHAYAVEKDLRKRMNEQDALWQETAQHLLERAEKAEAENEILRDKLSEMIVVNATCLACSPDIKKAYENLEQANARLKERLEES